MLATMLVDLDHLLASPVFDTSRCSVGFHVLHSWAAIAVYSVMALAPHLRLVAIGLLFHMFTDSFSLVFLDIMMSVIDGYDFLTIINRNKKKGNLKHLPNIVVQTAIQSYSQLANLARKEIVQEIIKKPITVTRIKECLSRYC